MSSSVVPSLGLSPSAIYSIRVSMDAAERFIYSLSRYPPLILVPEFISELPANNMQVGYYKHLASASGYSSVQFQFEFEFRQNVLNSPVCVTSTTMSAPPYKRAISIMV